MSNAAAILDAIEKALGDPRGFGGALFDGEAKLGARIVPVGAKMPFDFSERDWQAGSIVSVLSDEVRMVALLARDPGNGAFRRLVGAIERAGLRPVIVQPVGHVMPAIMRRWKWKRRVRGSGFESVEEWRPRNRKIQTQEDSRA